MSLEKLRPSLILIHLLRQAGSRLVAAYRINNRRNVIISLDGDSEQVHISISHAQRYPAWDEIKAIKYHFYSGLHMAIYIPSDPNYINFHENCLHLFEYKVA